ncbi:hypothetical protein ED28_16335 [[Pantoea] beijingensis]|uniref:M24 family metallopeptidase n=1 Tax=[Pantoea] beijingensis TaxID=1324864 RepID=A0A443IAT3_9GAMM|nr:M24 family metallopeptidase [[Pantoea] beijingensis]RWR01016.1 hypothetical protein ED28_16335 [[Pantoea] beijingensis]
MTEKLQRVRQLLREQQLDAVLITRRDNIAWLTEGKTFYVVDRAEAGVASLLVSTHDVLLIAPDNEMPRILAEEPLPFAITPRSYPWYQSLDNVLPTLALSRIGSDICRANSQDVQTDFVHLRTRMTPAECDRFLQLGRQTAAVIEKVARSVRPGLTEREVEARIYAACLPLGIRPVCTLIAVDTRISAFKHPIPGTTQMRKKMLLTLGAEREGLNVSMTRMVHAGPPSDASRQLLRSVAEIHADILMASRPARPWQDIFSDIQASYARHGFPEGWKAHHQGGPAGYGCRDFIVTPETPGVLALNQAMAWNPTLSGVKSEDTSLLTEDGPQWLTRTGDWPMMNIHRGDKTWQFADWLMIEP